MVVRGVLDRPAKDGWWLDDASPRRLPAVWLLLAMVICADQLIWAVTGGLGFVVWVVVVALAVHIAIKHDVSRARSGAAWGILMVSLLPAVDLVQPLSVGLALAGLGSFVAVMVVLDWKASSILRALFRLPGIGLSQLSGDVKTMRISAPSKGMMRGALSDWLVPLGIGAVFIGLMAMANPVVDDWLIRLSRFESGFSWSFQRVMFWAVAALMIWPLLRLTHMAGRLNRTPTPIKLWRSGLVNGRSVLRAMVVFNFIFAGQSLLDIGYLWGGATLPEGMTYAEYAHRGAYPLLVTALLAGAFALVSQPHLAGRPVLRGLLYLWVAQTVLLVLSSILRLDLYVDAYGLTRLRFVAFIWMIVVALGLVLMIAQMVMRQTIGWFMLRAAGLGLVAVYAVALVNVDGFIARHNLAAGKVDEYYLCQLSEGAAPAIAAHGGLICGGTVSTPADWREWGFRNARLRRSLAAINEVQG